MSVRAVSNRLARPASLIGAALLAACAHQSPPQASAQPPSALASIGTTKPATTPPQLAEQNPEPTVELQGQMSIKLQAFGSQPAKGLSLGFFFSGNAQAGQLDLMTLLGSQMARVAWQPGQAWLTNEKGQRRFDAIDELADEALGEPLPLRALLHWMQGQPDPSIPHEATIGATNAFAQSGWEIDTSELPIKKLTARRGASASQRGVTIKVYLDR